MIFVDRQNEAIEVREVTTQVAHRSKKSANTDTRR